MASISNGVTATTDNGTTDEHNNKEGFVVGIASKIARSNILELQPYRCARDDYSTGILLDANENSYGPPPSVKKEKSSSSSASAQPILELERYPDPYQISLKEQFIHFRGYNDNVIDERSVSSKRITAEHVFVGVGSDEAIDLLMRIFCIPNKDSILITPPTYGMYKVCAKVNDIPIITVPLTPQFDVQIPQVSDTQSDLRNSYFFVWYSPFVALAQQ
jgi:histidinol-phosphate aminotransferase